MLIDQAIFCSTNSNRYQGYHLVARSERIEDTVARALSFWSPSHDGLASTAKNACSVNFFKIDEEHFGISRSVFGGPEYSKRGGLQVVTMLLTVRTEQLSGYDYNVVSLLRSVLSMGYLTLPIRVNDELPQIDVPEKSLSRENHLSHPHLKKIAQAVVANERLAIVAVDDPLVVIDQLAMLHDPEDRLNLTFCTGLKPVAQRNFRLHFFSESNNQLRNQLKRDNIGCISFARLGQSANSTVGI